MDKGRIEGTERTMAGSIEEAIGTVTGDTRLQAEGQADKAAAGKAEATARDGAKA